LPKASYPTAEALRPLINRTLRVKGNEILPWVLKVPTEEPRGANIPHATIPVVSEVLPQGIRGPAQAPACASVGPAAMVATRAPIESLESKL